MTASRRFAIFCLIGILVPGFFTLPAEEAASPPDGVELAKARLYLADFQEAVDSDDEKALAAYDVLIAMPEFAQQGFLRYLDGEWEKRAKEYRLAASRTGDRSGPAVTAAISPEDRDRARTHQQALAAIRAIKSDNEMKKELKARGWTALQSLLAIFKHGEGGGFASGGGSDPTLPGKQVAAMKIGKFRQLMHSHLGTPLAQSPEVELGLKTQEAEDQEARAKAEDVKISASAADRAILEKNDALFAQIGSAEAAGIRQLNEWRIAAGLIPLTVDPKLCAAARDHCKDMATRGFFSHTSPVPGKKTPWDRAKKFGTSARGENIAINSSTQSANHSWFYSPGHHRNMFGNHTAIGFGASGRHFTQMFR